MLVWIFLWCLLVDKTFVSALAPMHQIGRRTVLTHATTAAVLASTSSLPVHALSDAKPTEFQNVGRQAPVPDGDTAPFITLNNGVQYKEFRSGSGETTCQGGSQVALQITGRLLNLNGVVFYNSKKNDPDGLGGIPVTFTVGKGQALPGLEAGIIGMKKGAIRRIIVPPELGYNKDGPYLEPIPVNTLDMRALDSVVQNTRRDATLLLDVKMERLK